MIDQKKVELMARTAMFEHQKKETMEFNRFSEKNYKESMALKSMILGAFLCALILFLIITARFPQAYEIYESIGLVWSTLIIAAILIFFSAAYALVSVYIFERRFEDTKGSFARYRLRLERLERSNDEE